MPIPPSWKRKPEAAFLCPCAMGLHAGSAVTSCESGYGIGCTSVWFLRCFSPRLSCHPCPHCRKCSGQALPVGGRAFCHKVIRFLGNRGPLFPLVVLQGTQASGRDWLLTDRLPSGISQSQGAEVILLWSVASPFKGKTSAHNVPECAWHDPE